MSIRTGEADEFIRILAHVYYMETGKRMSWGDAVEAWKRFEIWRKFKGQKNGK